MSIKFWLAAIVLSALCGFASAYVCTELDTCFAHGLTLNQCLGFAEVPSS